MQENTKKKRVNLNSIWTLMQYLLKALNKYSQRFFVFQKMNDLQTGDLDGDSCNEKKLSVAWFLSVIVVDAAVRF